MTALVSIITPSYNSAKFIAETIQSVQNQTYPNWEMIIVDDGSSDDTEDTVLSIAQNDNRIQFHKLVKILDQPLPEISVLKKPQEII